VEAARAASRRPSARRPPKYSALALLRHGLSHREWPRALPDQPLRDSYDVVIVGGGVHGLAAAYYLAVNHGITDVAVLDKGYIGGGGSGRSTAILRSNYLTPEGVRFYDRSMQLYRTLAADLDYNVMFSRRGHLTLAHNDSSLRTMRWRAEVNQLQGVQSEVIDPGEIKRLVPFLDTSAHPRYPILGALYHPPGGIIRHDAVVWGYARAAAARGVHIHQDTEVSGIDAAGPGRAHQAGDHRYAGRAQRDGRLVDAGGSDGRGPGAHPDIPAAGCGHRARPAVPARRRGVRHAARLRQPDRPRRARVRGERRPVRRILDARHAGIR
jgi:heterotetrameric sarcosine oxidase beta subunit